MRAPAAVYVLLLASTWSAFSQAPRLAEARSAAAAFEFSFPTVSNRTYTVNWGTLAPPNVWDTLTNVQGDGRKMTIRDPASQSRLKFYRVFAEAPLRYLTVGHVGPTTARLALGLDSPRDLQVVYSTNATLANATRKGPFSVSAAEDYTRAIDLSGLSPATRYFYNVLVDGQPYYSAPSPNFRTAPSHGTVGTVRFAIGSCYHGTSAGGYGTIPRQAPWTANQIWQSIAGKAPDFFVHLGDTAYCDNMNATELRSYRVVHRHLLDERLANMSAYAEFRRHFPFYTTWDDHEIRNDWPWDSQLHGPWSPGYLEPGKQAFREYHGRGNPDSPLPGELYYSLQFGDVGVFMTDTRSFRSCQQGEDSLTVIPATGVTITFNGSVGTTSAQSWNGGLGFTSGLVGRTLRLSNGQTRHIVLRHSPRQISVSEPGLFGTFGFSVLGKTILGATQKYQLKNWLLENKDSLRFKFIGTATPIHGLSEHITRKDAWGAGYEAELNEILDFTIANSIRNVIFLSGDQHWSGSFNRRRGPVNFFEFMSSGLASSSYPIYTGTNDTLRSRVNWMFDATMNQNRGENFGLVTVHTDQSPATVRFDLFDAQGIRLNSTSLQETMSGLELVP